MISYDQAGDILDGIAEELPPDFFKHLNGGVVLLPDLKKHPEPTDEELYILGEYRSEAVLGRSIVIYYGSFIALYGNAAKEEFALQLRKTLLHEFTHHIENLAGQRDLEIRDEEQMRRWKRKR